MYCAHQTLNRRCLAHACREHAPVLVCRNSWISNKSYWKFGQSGNCQLYRVMSRLWHLIGSGREYYNNHQVRGVTGLHLILVISRPIFVNLNIGLLSFERAGAPRIFVNRRGCKDRDHYTIATNKLRHQSWLFIEINTRILRCNSK